MKDKGLTIWKDQHEFSPCNFEIINWKQEMRKSKLYSWRVSSWYNTKFSCLLQEGNVWPLVKRITIQFLGVHRWNKLNSHNMRNEQWFQMHTILSLTTLDQRKKTKGLNGIHGLFTTIEVGSLVQVTLATIEIIWNKLLHYFSSVNMSVQSKMK